MTPLRERPGAPHNLLLLWPFQTWLSVVAIYSGLSYFLPLPTAGSARAVHVAVPALVPLWSALYALGGLGSLIGLIRRSAGIEAFGLHLLGSGATVATVAFLAAGAPILPTLVTNGGAVAACVARLFALHTLRR